MKSITVFWASWIMNEKKWISTNTGRFYILFTYSNNFALHCTPINICFFVTHIPCFQWQWVEWFVVIQGMHFHSHSLLEKITKFNSAIIYEIEFGNSKLKVENFCNTSQEFSEEILILLNSTLTIWICSIWGAAVKGKIYMNIYISLFELYYLLHLIHIILMIIANCTRKNKKKVFQIWVFTLNLSTVDQLMVRIIGAVWPLSHIPQSELISHNEGWNPCDIILFSLSCTFIGEWVRQELMMHIWYIF